MSNLKQKRTWLGISLVASLIIVFIGYVVMYPQVFGICSNPYSTASGYLGCLNNSAFSLGQPLFYGFQYLALVFGFLFLYPKAASAWKKFAIWFLPLALVLIFITPVSSNAFSPTPDRIDLVKWIGRLYVLVSGFILLYVKASGRKISEK